MGPIEPIGIPPKGVQPGSDINGENVVDTGDARVEDSSYYKSIIWVGANDDCVSGNDTKDRSCIRLIELKYNKQ